SDDYRPAGQLELNQLCAGDSWSGKRVSDAAGTDIGQLDQRNDNDNHEPLLPTEQRQDPGNQYSDHSEQQRPSEGSVELLLGQERWIVRYPQPHLRVPDPLKHAGTTELAS